MSNKQQDREWECIFVSEGLEKFCLSSKQCGVVRGILRHGRTEQQAKEIYSLIQELESCIEQKRYQKAKAIKNKVFREHALVLVNNSSSRGAVSVGCWDLSRIPENEREPARIKLEDWDKSRSKATEQLSFSVNDSERTGIKMAADCCNFSEISAFLLQASKGIADFIVNASLDGKDIALKEVFSLLYQAHALRDTKLFTEAEILSLGLTPEQHRRYADLLESKRGGLPTVAEP